jgi:hypothetical protein
MRLRPEPPNMGGPGMSRAFSTGRRSKRDWFDSKSQAVPGTEISARMRPPGKFRLSMSIVHLDDEVTTRQFGDPSPVTSGQRASDL